jgi:hypothetical protein
MQSAFVMKTLIFRAVIGALLVSSGAKAGELAGPGRFCGYAPIIDLLAGEKVTTLEGGIHGGSFRWEGAFGSLDVHGIGWARRPGGRIVKTVSVNKPGRFAQRRVKNGYSIAIWNGGQGAAYFNSKEPFTRAQLHAIDRVALFQEGQTPSDCELRTVFSWQ